MYLRSNLAMPKRNKDAEIFNTMGVVLVGGKSSRMKVDKSTLIIDGHTNLQRAQTLLTRCDVNDVVMSGKAVGQIPDHYIGGGPLAGILAVINAKQPAAILVIPVDMPLLTPDIINPLINHGQKLSLACCYQDHSLPIYLPVTDTLIDFLDDEFTSTRYRVHHKGPSFKHLLKHIGCEYLPTPQPQLLANANTPAQWNSVIQLL